MVAVILVSHGVLSSRLESLLKAAGWTPRRLPHDDGEGGLEAQFKSALAAPVEANRTPRTALIVAVDLSAADRVVEQILGQCGRLRVVVVTPDAMDREGRRAVFRALRAGADDFVAASALASEMVLRLTGRGRPRRREMGRLQRICGLQLERGTRRLRHGNRTVALTPCEYRVFSCLARRAGHAVSRATIQKDLARRSRSVSKNMVDVYVLYLRRKLATLECSCEIRTIRSVGYALSDPAVAETASRAPAIEAFVPSHLDA